jgi:UDP-N-acetylmuramoylalanine--D-glutamate ligase
MGRRKAYGRQNSKCKHVVMKSPGIPEKAANCKKVGWKKEFQLFQKLSLQLSLLQCRKTIGITGSNGKTTTTMLTYHLLKNGRIKCRFSRKYWKKFCVASSRRKF